jgi:hypothetical protein
MGCACRKKAGAKMTSPQTKKSASQIKVGRAVPRVPVTKRLPQGTRVRQ